MRYKTLHCSTTVTNTVDLLYLSTARKPKRQPRWEKRSRQSAEAGRDRRGLPDRRGVAGSGGEEPVEKLWAPYTRRRGPNEERSLSDPPAWTEGPRVENQRREAPNPVPGRYDPDSVTSGTIGRKRGNDAAVRGGPLGIRVKTQSAGENHDEWRDGASVETDVGEAWLGEKRNLVRTQSSHLRKAAAWARRRAQWKPQAGIGKDRRNELPHLTKGGDNPNDDATDWKRNTPFLTALAKSSTQKPITNRRERQSDP
ncbi:hypothetical protein NDU88_001201 [Pleurodeles waltl]|uniref:Uncharacterized protein n=1 Tax=Pleurodeles waltl TaxID=8319 RepID=A0AAV7TII0_PLEWA|nr:hypothetical protein NDU88_001201 [Pleurodeles waltl]